jgi:hypothetical protein
MEIFLWIAVQKWRLIKSVKGFSERLPSEINRLLHLTRDVDS